MTFCYITFCTGFCHLILLLTINCEYNLLSVLFYFKTFWTDLITTAFLLLLSQGFYSVFQPFHSVQMCRWWSFWNEFFVVLIMFSSSNTFSHCHCKYVEIIYSCLLFQSNSKHGWFYLWHSWKSTSLEKLSRNGTENGHKFFQWQENMWTGWNKFHNYTKNL